MSTDWIKKRLKMSSTLPLGTGTQGGQFMMGSAHHNHGHHHHHHHKADGSCCGHDHSHESDENGDN